jgi:hypothetical protein
MFPCSTLATTSCSRRRIRRNPKQAVGAQLDRAEAKEKAALKVIEEARGP